jgi:hypothetical protein
MFPLKYVPDKLSKKDKIKQIKALKKSQSDYKKRKYTLRPKLKSYKSKTSAHVLKARKIYNITEIKPSQLLAKKSGCNIQTLKKIQSKGMGAYYSGGSRPDQSAHSWGRARLASALSGGKSAAVDYKLLESGCEAKTKALKLAKQSKKKHGVGQRRVPKAKLT